MEKDLSISHRKDERADGENAVDNVRDGKEVCSETIGG